LVPASVRLGLVLLVVLIRVPSFFEPRWYSDEGFFTTVAWVTARGVPLYSGIYDNQPPVIFWLFRLTQALGSIEHHSVVQLTATAAVIAAGVLTFEVSRRYLQPWASALAAATGSAAWLATDAALAATGGGAAGAAALAAPGNGVPPSEPCRTVCSAL